MVALLPQYSPDRAKLLQDIDIDDHGFVKIQLEPDIELSFFVFSVQGMTCTSCVCAVETGLKQLDSVKDVKVNLLVEKVEIVARNNISEQELIEAIGNLGFDACLLDKKEFKQIKNLDSCSSFIARFSVSGMTCASCVECINRGLSQLNGVSNVSVQLLSEIVDLNFDSKLISYQEIECKINDLGFECFLVASSKISNETHRSCKIYFDSNIPSNLEKVLLNQFGPRITSVHVTKPRVPGMYGCVDLVMVDLKPRAIISFLSKMNCKVTLNDRTIKLKLDSLNKTKELKQWKWFLCVSLIFAIPMMAIMFFAMNNIEFHNLLNSNFVFKGFLVKNFIDLLLTVPCVFIIGGGYFFKQAYKSIRNGHATMDVLVALGVSITFVYSVSIILINIFQQNEGTSATEFQACVMLFFFISLGKVMENAAKGKASCALAKLMELKPPISRIIQDGKEVEIESDMVDIDDLVKVLPGEVIPVDGKVLEGQSQVDEALLTGESIAISKSKGSNVMAGTVNGSGCLLIKACGVGSDTTLSKIVQLVEQAQNQKAPMQNIADKIASYFIPIVIGLGLITFISWCLILFFFGVPKVFAQDGSIFGVALKIAISVIVVACPCALGLATPTALMVGTGIAAEKGILLKGGNTIEELSSFDTLVLDKTGTLTNAKLSVHHVSLKHSDLGVNEILEMLASVQSCSEHPLAKAFCSHYLKSSSYNLCDFISVPGRGVKGNLDQFQILMGNIQWMTENGIKIPAKELCSAKAFYNQGHSVVWVGINGDFVGFITFSDSLRDDAISCVSRLESRGIKVLMVTGDHASTANYFANLCGIKDVYSECSPSAKRDIIIELQKKSKVAMVGDGVNDSIALAQADVSIALKSGTEIAMEASSVVLMKNQLMDILVAIDICRSIKQRIYINYFWAAGYNLIGLPLAAGCFIYWGWFLNPIFASAMMAFSSVSVICSSLALRLHSFGDVGIFERMFGRGYQKLEQE